MAESKPNRWVDNIEHIFLQIGLLTQERESNIFGRFYPSAPPHQSAARNNAPDPSTRPYSFRTKVKKCSCEPPVRAVNCCEACLLCLPSCVAASPTAPPTASPTASPTALPTLDAPMAALQTLYGATSPSTRATRRHASKGRCVHRAKGHLRTLEDPCETTSLGKSPILDIRSRSATRCRVPSRHIGGSRKGSSLDHGQPGFR